MSRRSIMSPIMLAAALILWGTGPIPVAADVSQCMPWSEARPIIAERELVGSEKAAELAQEQFTGEVLVNVKFCKEGDDFVYLVFLLRTDTNALRRVVVDAVTGEL